MIKNGTGGRGGRRGRRTTATRKMTQPPRPAAVVGVVARQRRIHITDESRKVALRAALSSSPDHADPSWRLVSAFMATSRRSITDLLHDIQSDIRREQRAWRAWLRHRRRLDAESEAAAAAAQSADAERRQRRRQDGQWRRAAAAEAVDDGDGGDDDEESGGECGAGNDNDGDETMVPFESGPPPTSMLLLPPLAPAVSAYESPVMTGALVTDTLVQSMPTPPLQPPSLSSSSSSDLHHANDEWRAIRSVMAAPVSSKKRPKTVHGRILQGLNRMKQRQTW